VRRLLAFCFFCFAGSVASAQGVLPSGFSGWAASPTSAPNASLEQIAGADAPFLREYGFQAVEQRDYSRGGDTLHVTLYSMADPTAAYGAFTYVRPPDMRSSTLARYAALAPDRALVVVGNFLLDVKGKRIPHRADDDLTGLVKSVKPKADQRAFPTIADHLPAEGLIPGSERYILGPLALDKFAPLASGDWVGFGDSAEAIEATYRKGAQEATLLVIDYPTQQLAASHFTKIAPLVTDDSSANPSAAHPTITAQRNAGLVSIAFTSQRGTFAKTLLGQVIYGHDVVWNEPAPLPNEKPWPVYVIGAFAGTGLILVYTIISGLGFAVFRVAVNTFFPGKIFDRPHSIEILQLGLSERPINTRDVH
jgi:hypothetical protein